MSILGALILGNSHILDLFKDLGSYAGNDLQVGFQGPGPVVSGAPAIDANFVSFSACGQYRIQEGLLFWLFKGGFKEARSI